MRGKTIQIYLPDGSPNGIKICEITSGIAKGFLIPRNKLKEVAGLKELEKQGIYFLLSEKDELSQFQTYIGEAENLFKRIIQHKEDFWNYALCFISSKGHLNKAHIKFLEGYCFELAKKIQNSELRNSKIPTKSGLINQEKDLALDFFDELAILMATLGYSLFQEIKKESLLENIFYCKETVAYAEGNLTEEGFVVYKNSKTKLKESSSAGAWVEGIREKLKEKKILIQKGKVLIFTKDFVFNSPSTAATVVLARRANGWTEWKSKKNKKTLDEIKRRSIK